MKRHHDDRPVRRRVWVHYFQHRPQGHTLHSKAARAQIDARERPIILPEVLFLKFSGKELSDALAAKRGRS